MPLATLNSIGTNPSDGLRATFSFGLAATDATSVGDSFCAISSPPPIKSTLRILLSVTVRNTTPGSLIALAFQYPGNRSSVILSCASRDLKLNGPVHTGLPSICSRARSIIRGEYGVPTRLANSAINGANGRVKFTRSVSGSITSAPEIAAISALRIE